MIIAAWQKLRRFVRNVFWTAPSRYHITGRTLAKLLLASLKLQPVALVAQFTGMTSLVMMFWTSDINRVFLLIWYGFGIAQIYMSLRYVRLFWYDRDRVANIRMWLRRWMMLSVSAGVVWGVAGPAMMIPLSGISQVVTVAVVVAVTFASWPVYSCWLPSLTLFTFLSLTPLTVSVASQYGVSQTLMAAVILVVSCFILYSGRKLNELILVAILTDDKNVRLVKRLKTEFKRSEAARRTTQIESERRSRFFAAANHDIRQPLQAMGIYLDILKRRATPQTEPIIRQVMDTSATISTLVEQVLTVTRMEFGQLEMHPEHVAVAGLLNELANECRPIAQEKGIQLRVVSPKLTIMTDVMMVKRALKNLISNAIAYSDAKAPVPEVVIGARRTGDNRLTIGIYDCGPGLSDEDKQRVFETFYRGSAGKSRPGSGFGLGLSIVKGIADQLGVQLTVGSRVGRGSVFRMTFNIDESEQVDLLEAPVPTGAGIKPIEGRVVLLEDNRLVREALTAMISGWGATVEALEKPDEAFYERMARAENRPAIVVSDYNLGADEPSGLQVCGRLEAGFVSRVPLVLLTAVARDLIESDWRHARKRGEPMPASMPFILQKPANPRRLNEMLVKALRR